MRIHKLHTGSHSNHRENYKKYDVLEGWQTSFLKIEENYYSFNKKSCNRILINLRQNVRFP